MSIEDTIASLERNTRMGTSRSLMAHGGKSGNSTVLEGVYQERGHIPPHYHDCEEVILCAQGEGILFIGEEPHTFMAGATTSPNTSSLRPRTANAPNDCPADPRNRTVT